MRRSTAQALNYKNKLRYALIVSWKISRAFLCFVYAASLIRQNTWY